MESAASHGLIASPTKPAITTPIAKVIFFGAVFVIVYAAGNKFAVSFVHHVAIRIKTKQTTSAKSLLPALIATKIFAGSL